MTGEAPLVDTTSTTTGSNYSAKVIDKLPGRAATTRRSCCPQPGVQTDDGETQGRALALSIYGSTSAENLFLIDGVNTTNVIKGFQGKNINTEFIQEVEVKTGGYQAEYGRNTGGVINVITKSGGNEFHGDVFGYYNTPGMSANQNFETTPTYSQSGRRAGTRRAASSPTGQRARKAAWTSAATSWKDRIWFFGAYDRVDDRPRPRAARPASVAGERLPSTTSSEPVGREADVQRRARARRSSATMFSDPQTNTGALLVPARLESGRRTTAGATSGGTDYAGRLNQLFGSFGILTAPVQPPQGPLQHRSRGHRRPADVVDRTPTLDRRPRERHSGGFGEVFGPTDQQRVEARPVLGRFTGVLRQQRGQGRRRLPEGRHVRLDLLHGLDAPARSGPARSRARASATSLAAPFYTTPQGTTCRSSTSTDYLHGERYGSDASRRRRRSTTPTNRTGAYLQDQWRILPTLTVNAGVRYDRDDRPEGQQRGGVQAEEPVGAAFRIRVGFRGRRDVASCTAPPGASTTRSRPT